MGERKIGFYVSIPESSHAILKAEADRMGATVTELVRIIVRNYIKRRK